MKDAIMTLNRFVVDIEKKAWPQKNSVVMNTTTTIERDGLTDRQTDRSNSKTLFRWWTLRQSPIKLGSMVSFVFRGSLK